MFSRVSAKSMSCLGSDSIRATTSGSAFARAFSFTG